MKQEAFVAVIAASLAGFTGREQPKPHPKILSGEWKFPEAQPVA